MKMNLINYDSRVMSIARRQALLIADGMSPLEAALECHIYLIANAIENNRPLPKKSIYLARKIKQLLKDDRQPVDKHDEFRQAIIASMINDFNK